MNQEAEEQVAGLLVQDSKASEDSTEGKEDVMEVWLVL